MNPFCFIANMLSYLAVVICLTACSSPACVTSTYATIDPTSKTLQKDILTHDLEVQHDSGIK